MALLLLLSASPGYDAAMLRCAGALVSALSHHSVPLALVLEAPSALDTGPLFEALQPLAARAASPLLVAQPAQLLLSLRSALAQLGAPPLRQVLLVSLAAEPTAPVALGDAAAALSCAALHAPPGGDPAALALGVLQRFAALQRAGASCLVVGYVMKRSRQLSLSVEGMLPALPTDGLCFMPLDLDQPLAAQQPFDILLHKPTDYLEEVPGSGRVPGFTQPLLALLAQLQAQRPGVCIVDPLSRVQTVMDRAALGTLLDGVAAAARRAGVPLRSPRWALLQGWDGAAEQLRSAGLQLPLIVKPQVACGVSESHQMALVLAWEGLGGLGVPLPAVAQEYVDHGGLVWKVYAAGSQVFTVQRKSTPDLAPLVAWLVADPAADAPSSIGFDSLKSLPTSLPWARRLEQQAGAAGRAAGAAPADSKQQSKIERQLGQATIELVAALLREQLQLTLFGFDIVISDAGELVIIDVNFFPSYKGHPEAPGAVRAALRDQHRRWQATAEGALH